MDTFTKKCSWGADTRSRAAGWGTPTGSARPRSCARGRCSGTGPSSRRRRSPRGLLPNSRRPPNDGEVGQSLQRFTTKIGRHAPRHRCHCQRRRHAAAAYRRWRGAAKGGLKPSLWSSSPFLTRERGRRRRLWIPNFSSSTSLSLYICSDSSFALLSPEVLTDGVMDIIYWKTMRITCKKKRIMYPHRSLLLKVFYNVTNRPIKLTAGSMYMAIP